MKLFVAFMFGVMAFTIWEERGGPQWRWPIVVGCCAVIAIGFTSLRVT